MKAVKEMLVGAGKAVVLAIVIVAIGFVMKAAAQGVEAIDLVPRWSFALTTPVNAVGQNGGDTYHSSLFPAGLGPQITVNFVDSENFPWIGLGLPMYFMSASENDMLGIFPGLVVTIGGNWTVGAAYALFNSQNGVATGFMTGHSSWKDDGKILVGFALPIGENAGIWTMGR